MELIDIDGDSQPSKVFVGRLILPQTEEISDRGVPDTILVTSDWSVVFAYVPRIGKF